MEMVSVINYKGGVGKTTTTANIAAQLAWNGNNVLLVDLDPQASLTFSLIAPDNWEAQQLSCTTISARRLVIYPPRVSRHIGVVPNRITRILTGTTWKTVRNDPGGHCVCSYERTLVFSSKRKPSAPSGALPTK